MALQVVRIRILLMVGMVLVSACLVLSYTPGNASAATGPTQVRGHVYDPYEDPAVGADVKVELLNKDTGEPRLKYWEGVTDSSGYYLTTQWAPSEWEVGDTIRVTVTYNSEQKVQTKVSIEWPTQTVDVHFPTAIPQLGGLIGSLITVGLIALVAVAFVPRKGHKAG